MQRFAAWLAEQRVALTPDTILSEPRRGLALIPRAMQPHADRVHERWSFTGPLLDPGRLDPAAWTPPAGGRPRSRRAADAEALRAAVTAGIR